MGLSSGMKLGSTVLPFPPSPSLHNIHRMHYSPPTSISFSSPTSPHSEDFDDLLNKYQHVSRFDLEKLQHVCNDDCFVSFWLERLNERRDTQEAKGRYPIAAGPIVEVLSAAILPHNVGVTKPLAIYGRIYLEFRHVLYLETITRDLFNRGHDDPEIIASNPTLTLTSPNDPCDLTNLYSPLHETKIVVDLWDADQKVVFARDSFFVRDETTHDYYGQVNCKVIPGIRGSLAVHYFSMQFAVLCHVVIRFLVRNKGNTHRVLNVYGEIVARYGNTYNNYADEGNTLFRKFSHEFEQVVVDEGEPHMMRLPRSWLSLPAYASLIIDFNLFDFDTKRSILKDAVEFVPEYSSGHEAFVVGDYVLEVKAQWMEYTPGPCRLVSDSEEENEVHGSSDTQLKQEPHVLSDAQEEEVYVASDTHTQLDEEAPEVCNMQEGDEAPEVCNMQEGEAHVAISDMQEEKFSNNNPSSKKMDYRVYDNLGLRLDVCERVEVFSIFIGGQKMLKSLRLYGTIEVWSIRRSFYIYRRDEEDAFELSQHIRFLPILDGSREYGSAGPPGMKFDLKDVGGNLVIKGFIEWDEHMRYFSNPSRLDNQLCHVLQGKHGFAAVQYSIFDMAYQANIEVCYKIKKGGSYGVYGSLIAEYDSYDYSTRFQKDLFRIVFFERVEQDTLKLGMDGKIPLSRSTVVVPEDDYDTALNIKANLKLIDLSSGVTHQCLSHVVQIEIGMTSASMETEDCIIDIYFKWMTQ